MKKIFVMAGLSFSMCSLAEVDLRFLELELGSYGSEQTVLTSGFGSTSNAESDLWDMEYIGPKVSVMPLGKSVIPIVTKKSSLVLKHADKGQFEYSGQTVRSATRVSPAIASASPHDIFPHRPTLFISIPGTDFEREKYIDIDRIRGHHKWQTKLEDRLNYLSDTRAGYQQYQYKHFIVNWDNHKSMGEQPRQLAGLVNDFLTVRTLNWDVVIIGHSRGGIFAHELASLIIGNSKIEKLHTFLLDPTAANVFVDRYPTSLPENSNANHFWSLFYDNREWIDIWESEISMSFDVGTSGDKIIPGYTNYDRNDHLFNASFHGEIGNEWVFHTSPIEELTGALGDILSKKSSGTYLRDGLGSKWEYVTVRAASGIVFSGDVTVMGDQINLWGDISSEGYTIGRLDATVGLTEAEISSGALLGTSKMIIERDRLAHSEGGVFASSTGELTPESMYLSVNDGLISSGSLGVELDSVTASVSVFGYTHTVDSGDVIESAATGGISTVKKVFGGWF